MTTLCLDFNQTFRDDAEDNGVDGCLFDEISTDLRLPQLQTLNISSVTCAEPGLFDFLFGHKDTLESLSSTDLFMESGSWKNLLFALYDQMGVLFLEIHKKPG